MGREGRRELIVSQGWHRLATAYFNALSREKEREKNNMIAQGGKRKRE